MLRDFFVVFSPRYDPVSLFLMSRVQSGPHIQQAVGMLGLIPGNSLGGRGKGADGV